MPLARAEFDFGRRMVAERAVSIRNDLIYFDNASKRSIFEHIPTYIRSDGYMLFGGSETLLGLNVPFGR